MYYNTVIGTAVNREYVGSNPSTRASMFIYIIEKLGNSKYIDKYNCKENCKHCSLRFSCYTREWRTFRSQDDVGAVFERKEIPHIPLNLAYCCRLVTGKIWDAQKKDYVPEI